jgi:uncharacterized protein (TIGR03118 family)
MFMQLQRAVAFSRSRHTRRLATRRLSLENLEARCPLSANAFVQTDLVSSISGVARHTNANVVNPWGIVASGDSQFQVAINGTGNALNINQSGSVLGQPIVIPPPMGSAPGATAAPSGEVANATSDFVVSEGGRSGPARLLFSTEDGTISGFNSKVDKTNAILKVDESASGDVFKGLALGNAGGHNYLYATDFHNGAVDVFDASFAPHTFAAGQFTDPHPVAGYAPFGITDVNGTLFITYAKQNAEAHDDVAGAGNGFIDAFDTSGHFLARVVTGTGAGGTNGDLNSPWGMTIAPRGFGPFGGDLLVGNFGDSHVTAFNVSTLTAAVDDGQLADKSGKPLVLTGGVMGTESPTDTKGLWGLAFGKDENRNALFFTSGINDESDGLFGKVTTAVQHGNGQGDNDQGENENGNAAHSSKIAAAAQMNASGQSDKRHAIDTVLKSFDWRRG